MTRFAMLITCGLAACGGDSGGGGGGGTDGGSNEALVNGVPASQYYGQFAYQMTNTGVDGAAAFPLNASGNNAFLVTFFMMPNGGLQLFYAEGEGDVTATGWSLNIAGNTKKKRSGTWRIDGAQLVLDSFMRCDGMLFNDKPALRCTLTSAILTAGAQGKGGMFQKRISASSPDGSEFAEYVP